MLGKLLRQVRESGYAPIMLIRLEAWDNDSQPHGK
jgi:hypothetical protein